MKIFFTLYEDEGIDPIDPVGDIILTDGQTDLLVESTYLDSWFETLIDGLEGLQSGKKSKLEIVEEPGSIIFEPLTSGFKISYRGREIMIENLANLIEELTTATQEFISKLNLQGEVSNKNTILPKIQDFVKKNPTPQTLARP